MFNLTDGEPVSKRRFIGRVAELAGLPAPTRKIPLRLAKVLAGLVEGVAKLRGAKNPPLINKARYKFLGLNLDYSIDKARKRAGLRAARTRSRSDRTRHGRALGSAGESSTAPAAAVDRR